MSKNNPILDNEVALLPVEHQIFLLASLHHAAQIFQTDRKRAFIDTKVIHENIHYVLNQISKDGHHATLKGRKSIAQAEWHSPVGKRAIWACERRLPLVIWVDRGLKET